MIAVGSIYYTVFISVVANFFGTLDRVNKIYLHYYASIEYFRSYYGVPDALAWELLNYYKGILKGNLII
jgi:hypothetical protein